MCPFQGEVIELHLGQDPLTKIYACPKCLASLPEKLEGLPIRLNGKIIGKILKAEWI